MGSVGISNGTTGAFRPTMDGLMAGAEVEADRKVFFEPHAHFFDTYAPPPLRQLERRYAHNNGIRSVWTVEAANGGRTYFHDCRRCRFAARDWLVGASIAGAHVLPTELSDIHPRGPAPGDNARQ